MNNRYDTRHLLAFALSPLSHVQTVAFLTTEGRTDGVGLDCMPLNITRPRISGPLIVSLAVSALNAQRVMPGFLRLTLRLEKEK